MRKITLFVMAVLMSLVAETQNKAIAQATGGHEWVDMGLSVKWATCNVGANAPEDYGDYFAWGETSPKNIYSWYNLKHSLFLDKIKFSKYVTIRHIELDYGSVDCKAVLDPEDDAASANWGGNWRMPTATEFEELIDMCTWIWTTMNGKNGYKVVSKVNGNSIFFPASGHLPAGIISVSLPASGDHIVETNSSEGIGYYWSKSLFHSDPGTAYCLFFNWTGATIDDDPRYKGHSVRPVCHVTDEHSHVQDNVDLQYDNIALQYSEDERLYGVDLGLSVKWATCNLGASGPEESGRYFAWGDVKGQTWNGSWSEGGFSEPLGFAALRRRYELSDHKLTPEYDAAHVNLGDKWRMPTAKEFEELFRYCNVVWVTVNGAYGILFTSKKPGYEDKSIFLPAVGTGVSSDLIRAGILGIYWSLNLRDEDSNISWGLEFNLDEKDAHMENSLIQYYGRSVRPVSEY